MELYLHSLERDGVKCSPELVEELSQLKSHIVLQTGSATRDANETPVSLAFHPGAVSIWVDERSPLRCEGFRVHCGPVDSLPAIRKHHAA